MIEEKIINNERYRHAGLANYWVSEYGNVINFNNYPLKIMKPFITNDFHLRIELNFDGKRRKFYIHRLVYKAFVGSLIDGLVIEHLDSNPMNNHYTNLKQSTQKENIKTAINYGTFGGNHNTSISIYDTYLDKIYTFNKIANCVSFCGLYGDSKSKLKRSSTFNNRFKILEENNIESASTIETIYPDAAGIEKGVEYNKGETPLVTFNIT